MKILYLCHRIPYPPNKGDKIRSFNEIKYLSSNHEIHLACLADDPSDLKYKHDLESLCKKVFVAPLNKTVAKLKSLTALIYNMPLSVVYFYSNSLQSTVNRWLSSERYDTIICFSSPMAEYLFRSPALKYRFTLPHAPCALRLTPRLIIDFCDLDSDKWLQYSKKTRFPMSLAYRIESKLLLKYEKQINQRFDHSVFVSKQEASLFQSLFPKAENISVIPNGVDYKYFSPQASGLEPLALNPKTPVLLFTGAMDYYANVDGVTWFSDTVFPGVKKEFQAAKFYIVGSNPPPRVKSLDNGSGIRVTGFVEDIRPCYQAADICVIPLRLARGVQNKVLEAMAMEKAVVTTSKAIQGIYALDKQNVLVADTPKGFCKAVLTLLKDHKARKQLGQSAREFVIKNHNWSNNMKQLEALLQGRNLS
jgi:sugar transferase (PEP-CTERM/EpsH1 system associated)